MVITYLTYMLEINNTALVKLTLKDSFILKVKLYVAEANKQNINDVSLFSDNKVAPPPNIAVVSREQRY